MCMWEERVIEILASKMPVQAHSFSCPSGILPRTLDSATTQFRAIRNEWRLGKFGMFSSVAGKWNYHVFQLNGITNVCFRQKKNRSAIFSASEGQNSTAETARKRKVVEHVCLLKAKEDLSDEKENEMMDYLYTSQYQMGGIVAVSLGRILDRNLENYTHAFYMRFQRKEDVAKFYNNPFYLGVLKDYVMPYCHGLVNVDYESYVEDDILPIFRKGEVGSTLLSTCSILFNVNWDLLLIHVIYDELILGLPRIVCLYIQLDEFEFNYGVEFILLFEFIENALGKPGEDALAYLAKLTTKFPSLIVQATQGSNFNVTNKEYTHGAVIRFKSFEAFELFTGCLEYKEMWMSKFQPIVRKILSIHFAVDPVGTEIM